jgi:hypothetical protein
LLRIRIEKEQGNTLTRAEADATLDRMAGLVTTNLHGLAARIYPHDVAARRRVEGFIFEIRSKIGQAAAAAADAPEPPR